MRLFLSLLLVMAAVPALPVPAAATAVSELLADPEGYSDDTVTITGELVGDYSRREEGVWVQVNDDPFVSAPIVAGGEATASSTGVGALIPAEIFDAIVAGPAGRYGRTGPVVELNGTFRYHDARRGGETYLQVETAALVDGARDHPVPGPDRWLWIGSSLLVAAGAAATLIRRSQGSTEE